MHATDKFLLEEANASLAKLDLTDAFVRIVEIESPTKVLYENRDYSIAAFEVSPDAKVEIGLPADADRRLIAFRLTNVEICKFHSRSDLKTITVEQDQSNQILLKVGDALEIRCYLLEYHLKSGNET